MTADWEHIRKHARSKERPSSWPENIQAISLSGLALLGIDDQNRLYWDGSRIEVRNRVNLTFWQRIGAVAVVISAVVGALAAAASALADWVH